ncbi:MAG TPA: 1-deoxy-D-xylulose-5-phosphate synthase [Syntrophorhabdaceae bacterium]|nr:1-deoxy-D-xylulose-5-phosphate synthase [Syntrophorhabdaceae bacterium]
MTLLNKNLFPEHIKELDQEHLTQLASEIRETIIRTVSRNGGHLASSLGVVEITLALHRVFDAPTDKIVWDVGHQCYPHKLVTGRFDRFDTLRQFEGISGFPKTSESPYDAFDTGHSGTSISAALGMAIERDLSGLSHKVIAVIGDGSLTNGMALEAMNHAGFMGTDLIVVLNDNEKSISKNVGAYSRYLNRLRMEFLYRMNRKKNLPSDEKGSRKLSTGLLAQFMQRARHVLTPSRTGAVFEELGFKYLGPIDGHDIAALCDAFESAKRLKGPILIHLATSKGKGYRFAEEDPVGFHGIGSFNHTNGKIDQTSAIPTYTSVFGETLVRLARNDARIVAITAAMKDGTGLSLFKERYPSRFFDVGIAEEHAVTFAAGLAKSGAKPFVAIYSTFLQRAYDQILHDVCLQNLPVKFIIDRSGIVGEDGPTHHGAFDLSYLRSMPNMVIMAPKDENELQHLLRVALEHENGPIALRFSRGKGLGIPLDDELKSVRVPSWEIVRQGRDIAILAVGSSVHPSVQAASLLEESGINATVINARFVKPLDEELMQSIAESHKYIITVEENALKGGFGSGVLESLSDRLRFDARVARIGLPDRFIEHGSQGVLRQMYGLTAEKIAATVTKIVHEKE